MEKRNFIIQAEEMIKMILKELGLKPLELVEKTMTERKKDLKRYYNSVCEDNNRNKYFFKANIVEEEETYENFAREIWLNKSVANLKNKENLNVQLYIKDGWLKKVRWALFNFVEGKPIGSIFDFDKEFDDKKDSFIEGILNNLEIIQKKSNEIFRGKDLPRLEKHNGDWYYNELLGYKDKVVETIGEEKYNFVLKQIKDNKEFFDRECKFLAHGDFALSNQILEAGTQKIHTGDWEDIHFDNQAADLAFLWMQTWKYSNWRKKALKSFFERVENKENFRKLFVLVIMQLSVREIMFWKYNNWFEPIKTYVSSKKALEAHNEALNRAEKGFDFLLS